MSKSLIITFEGIEGSGKTLHINNVSRYLSKKKINFLKLREPGGSKNAELIRKIILNKKSNFNQKTDLLLYLASRSENIDFINNKKNKPKIILIDRFVDSTIAYQHYGMNLDNKIINILNKYILGNKKVDFTDFVILANGFSQAGGWRDGDFSGDSYVGFPDFVSLSTNFGKGEIVIGTPEPTSWWHTLFGIFGIVDLRRRRILP